MTEQISHHWRSVTERLTAAQGVWAQHALSALTKQVAPSPDEQTVLPYENADPLGASLYMPAASGGKKAGTSNERLIHQYKNRCLFLSTGKCFCRCRYCFRRESSVLNYSFASAQDIGFLCDYIAEHTEVRELLVSGGDPLTGTDRQLEALFSTVRSARKDVLIRVCTRAPVFAPERFTPHLKALLKSFKPLWIIPHINHSAEFSPQFSPESYRVLNDLIDCGIPMQSQTVLLRGVNNNIEELVSLFQGLTEIGIKPGYLFQGDLAPGTAHFRVPIDEGIKLYERLRYELSGLSLPVYAVDIPGGGGKFNLLNLNPAAAGVCAEKTEHAYVFKTERNVSYAYPREM